MDTCLRIFLIFIKISECCKFSVNYQNISTLYTYICYLPCIETNNSLALLLPLVNGDTFGRHVGNFFSTKDRDYDKLSLNCANKYHGAWWYHACSYLNLNGFYEVPGTRSARYYGNGGVVYRQVDGYLSLKETKMMFRRSWFEQRRTRFEQRRARFEQDWT